jgi:mannose-6-phosphate isomerase-like protein (cupin superfamily)
MWLIQPEFITKSWGWVKWFDNNELYCGKEIFVLHNKWSSKGKYHYHKLKPETFYVIKGILKIDYFNENNIECSIIVRPGESFRIEIGMKHRFTSLTKNGCKFIEVSTTHDDSDSYRCEFIDGQWVE